jgi:hypothetical protein
MKLDPGIHIIKHLVFFGKSGVTWSSSSRVGLAEPSPVRLAYQPPASSTFLSEQISHQQPASSTFLSEQISHQQPANSTFLSEQISISHQPPAKRTGWKPCQTRPKYVV